uniref:Uncharacterized protein n=1 Tax=Entomoneis paludosa TaxID=265537 RepID=A0A7S2YI60_9STRA|mmetsp:Transcript_3358/g.6965  ORF Transcript_3358/g.6965 Transcript_3358/m.6965 type:complete len:237 (+) Transcript_3358:62-772(+)|eukprot:CAMPEP_0172467812 /NCGR_PEP_ID=MMETSP1065-20121228/59893_1 /TAXON_ID=265537 /ORGANISM="Amphiprora paludosa, Strain CCMP125" /LENGTH=236 /DNA_ID=CAMNT_0013225061 /DNA_START=57 /DNA_END=770 /DNA_ORIENTATION=-
MDNHDGNHPEKEGFNATLLPVNRRRRSRSQGHGDPPQHGGSLEEEPHHVSRRRRMEQARDESENLSLISLLARGAVVAAQEAETRNQTQPEQALVHDQPLISPDGLSSSRVARGNEDTLAAALRSSEVPAARRSVARTRSPRSDLARRVVGDTFGETVSSRTLPPSYTTRRQQAAAARDGTISSRRRQGGGELVRLSSQALQEMDDVLSSSPSDSSTHDDEDTSSRFDPDYPQPHM